MASTQIIQSVHQLFESACVELFQNAGCNIRRILEPSYDVGDVPIASIDAGSNDLEVMLLLRVPLSLLALSHPSEDVVHENSSSLEEWIPELANQLIGKLKNRLLKFGCNLSMGLPCAHFGSHMESILPDGFEHALFYFEVDNEIFECCLSIAVFNEALSLESAVNSDDTGISDGELEMF